MQRRRRSPHTHVVGIGRTRRRTSYFDRFDAMTHTDLFDCRLFLMTAVLGSMMAATVLNAIALLNALVKSLSSAPTYLLNRIIDAKNMMIFLALLLFSIAYCKFLDFEDRIFFIRRPNHFSPKRNRTFDTFYPRACYRDCRFHKQHLRKLKKHWRIPDVCWYNDRDHSGEEYILLFLACIGTGMTYVQLSDCIFGGDPRRFRDMFCFVVCHLYDNFCHKITNNSLSLWLPHNATVFIQAISRQIEKTAVEVFVTDAARNVTRRLMHDLFDMANARVLGLIDCLGQGTARLRDHICEIKSGYRQTRQIFSGIRSRNSKLCM